MARLLMQVWNILGIEATDDAGKIKKAYAAKLKQHHPEDDPEGYQRLREAYDQALKLAKQQRKKAESLAAEESQEQWDDARPFFSVTGTGQHEGEGVDEFEPELGPGEIEGNEPGFESGDGAEEETERETTYVHRHLTGFGQNLPPEPSDPMELFMERIERLYDDFPSRIDPDRWMELLHSDAIWNVSIQSNLSDRFLYFMDEHYFVPEAVWTLLERTFHWSETAAEDPEDFRDEFPNVYAYAVEKPSLLHMGYGSLVQANETDIEHFLWLREKGLLAMLDQKYEAAAMVLEEASEMFGADPDVVRLLAECYAQTGEQDKALQAGSRLIQLQPDEIDGYLYRARLWFDQGSLNECLYDANRVLERFPTHMSALSLAGRCYMKLGDFDKAYDMFKRITDEQPDDIEAVLAMADINMQKFDELKTGRTQGGTAERKKLQQALGKKPLGTRLKQGGYFLLTGKWFSLIILVILQLYAASSFAKYTGESLIGYFVHADKPLEIRTVASVDELGRLPAKVDGVRFALENAEYTGVVQVATKEEDEEEIRYLKEEEAQKQGPDSVISGYLFVGELNGKQLIVLANQEQAEQMGGRGKIELEGTVRDTDPDIVSEYQAWRSQMAEPEAAAAALPEKDEADKIKNSLERMKKIQNNLPFMYPEPETYIDTVKAPTSDGHVRIPVRFYILLFILALFYISVIAEIRRIWRFLRYN